MKKPVQRVRGIRQLPLWLLFVCMTPWMHPSHVLAQAFFWGQSSYELRAQSHDGSLLPTNALVQIITSPTNTAMPPLDFGFAHGLSEDWMVYDTAKPPVPGFIIGYSGDNEPPNITTRVILLPEDYTGNGTNIPNPTAEGGLWMAQIKEGLLFNVTSNTWTFVPLDPNKDADGDGMIDGFEWRYFNNPTNASSSGDTDMDGSSNGDEAVAQTNPTDSNSYFAVTATPSTSGGQVFDMRWLAQSNVVYGIECFTNLVHSEYELVLSNIVVGITQFYTTNFTSTGDALFYRLKIDP